MNTVSTANNTQQMPVTNERLFQFAWSYGPPLLIETAVRYRVFDALEEESKTLLQVARETNTSRRGLRAVMDALTGFQLLSKDAHGKYGLTPESATFLVKGKPGYMGGFFRHMTTKTMPDWMQLPEVVKTGQPVRTFNEPRMGTEYFQSFVEHLFPLAYPAATLLGDALKLSEAQSPVRVLDLATGSGVWGIALAQKSPLVQVTAVDWSDVLPVTRRTAARYGVDERFHYVGGDLLEADLGEGHDIAMLGHILHSMGDVDSRALLRRTSAALKPGGTIAIAEFIVDEERARAVPALLFAVMMLIATENGGTFTLGEISEWLRDAGFENIRLLPAPGPSPLILADKRKV